MDSARRLILAWAERGHIATAHLPRALEVAGVHPPVAAWRRFLDRLLLGSGVLLLGSGVVFFFAANWSAMHRFGRFALVELLMLGTLGAVWRLGLERPGGRAALAGACLLVGVLLGLIGQTYQTGADTFELFGLWAAFVLPLALAGRSAVVWMLWLVLVNVATVLYYGTFGGLFGPLAGPRDLQWALLGINTAALAVWELVPPRRSGGSRWAERLLATASGASVTALALDAVMGHEIGGREALAVAAAGLAWLAAAHHVYRRRRLDPFVLSLGVLVVALVGAALVTRWLLEARLDATGLLVAGAVMVGVSAAGGAWIRRVMAEDAQ